MYVQPIFLCLKTFHLKESAPQFLAELLEDDDERVEKKMEETVRKIEEVFGESLQNYF